MNNANLLGYHDKYLTKMIFLVRNYQLNNAIGCVIKCNYLDLSRM